MCLKAVAGLFVPPKLFQYMIPLHSGSLGRTGSSGRTLRIRVAVLKNPERKGFAQL